MMTEKVQPGIYGNTKYLSLSQRLLLHQNLHMNINPRFWRYGVKK
jgi:hypothetical protein